MLYGQKRLRETEKDKENEREGRKKKEWFSLHIIAVLI